MLGVSIGLVLADLQLSKYWSAIYDMPSYGWSLPVLWRAGGGGEKIRDKTIRDKITIKQKPTSLAEIERLYNPNMFRTKMPCPMQRTRIP